MYELEVMSKALVWHLDGIEYKILNVPVYEMHSQWNGYYDLDVTLKIAMIRDLMYADEIPYVVDFNDVSDLTF